MTTYRYPAVEIGMASNQWLNKTISERKESQVRKN